MPDWGIPQWVLKRIRWGMSQCNMESMMKPEIKQFIAAVCDKKGLRFAVELHHALAGGRNDNETRQMLQEAIKAIR